MNEQLGYNTVTLSYMRDEGNLIYFQPTIQPKLENNDGSRVSTPSTSNSYHFGSPVQLPNSRHHLLQPNQGHAKHPSIQCRDYHLNLPLQPCKADRQKGEAETLSLL